jgi:hypothetical protein
MTEGNKKIAVMQPYLFPYIGYFHLIKAVDEFVIFDDVNFIKKGWINRNNILLNNAAYMWTLPLISASQNKLINEIEILSDEKEISKLLKLFKSAYSKAKNFDEVYGLIENIFSYENKNLAKFIGNSLQKICEYLEIKTKFTYSSDVKKDSALKGGDKIIAVCKSQNSSRYFNAIGGMELYSKDEFKKDGVDLFFVKSKPVQYKQFSNDFVPWLSIIDVMMFCDKAEIQNMLNSYEII